MDIRMPQLDGIAATRLLAPTVTRRLIALVVGDSDAVVSAEHARDLLATLSPREREVALAVGQGHGNAEIAEALHLPVATIKGHAHACSTSSKSPQGPGG
jgi:DNA-binding NarL/FixJ family response regulator